MREVIAREPDTEVVAEFRSPAEAIPVVAEIGSDIVLLDAALENPSVAAAIRRLTHGARESAVIVVGGADDDASIVGAIAVGAAAHVSEVAEPDELAAAIRRVAHGEDPLKEELIPGLISSSGWWTWFAMGSSA